MLLEADCFHRMILSFRCSHVRNLMFFLPVSCLLLVGWVVSSCGENKKRQKWPESRPKRRIDLFVYVTDDVQRFEVLMAGCVLGCYALQCGIRLPTFRKLWLPTRCLTMEAAKIKLWNVCQTTRRNIPEGCQLQSWHHQEIVIEKLTCII
jgi:hypothetical protein